MTRATNKCICSAFPLMGWLYISSWNKSGVFSVFWPLDWVFRQNPGYAVIYKGQTTQTLDYMTRATNKCICSTFPLVGWLCISSYKKSGDFSSISAIRLGFPRISGYAVICKWQTTQTLDYMTRATNK